MSKKPTAKKIEKEIIATGRGGTRNGAGRTSMWGKGILTATVSFRVPKKTRFAAKTKIDAYILKIKNQLLEGA